MSNPIWAELYVQASSLLREPVCRLIDQLVALRLTDEDRLNRSTHYSLHVGGGYEPYDGRPIAEAVDVLVSTPGCVISLNLERRAMNREASDFWVDVMLGLADDERAYGMGSVSLAMSQVWSRNNPSWFPEFLALTRLLAELMDATYGWVATEIKVECAPVSAASVAALEPQPLEWVNIYGASYVEKIGYERMMTVPAGRAEVLANGGVMVTLGPTPWAVNWDGVRAVAKHLGLPLTR